MFACRFIFEAYAKNVREKTTKCSYWCSVGCWWTCWCLPEFDAYQGAAAPSYFKSHTYSWCPYFFQKKVFPMSGLKFTLIDVTSVLPDNLSGFKKLFSDLYRNKYTVRASTTPNNCFVNCFSFNLEKQPSEEVYKIRCT